MSTWHAHIFGTVDSLLNLEQLPHSTLPCASAAEIDGYELNPSFVVLEPCVTRTDLENHYLHDSLVATLSSSGLWARDDYNYDRIATIGIQRAAFAL